MAKRLPSLHWLFAVSFCLFGVFISIEPAQAQVNVTTYHYDNARTGQNTQETLLTPANVGSTVFGKLFSVPVDGAVYAQPLILTNVMVAGVVHNNVSYVATEHDSVYAIDSDNGTILWQVSFINPAAGITTIPSADVNCTDIQPEVGITATPVIDPVGGALYVMALTKENGSYAQTLHALDVTSGAEMFGGPVLISASVLGSGDGTDGINVSFNPLTAGNRSALLLENGHVIIGWASYCDNGPYHGWVMSYSATTLAQEAVFNTTPNAGLGGVWMSGAGLASDSNFNVYLATGNGTYDSSSDYGDSVMKLVGPVTGGFTVADWFTPYTQFVLAEDDTDQGSGGVLVLPDQPITAPHQHLLLQGGKDGTIYLLDRDNLGKFNAETNNVVQSIPGALSSIFGVPAWWNNVAYFSGTGDFLMAYPFDPVSGMLDLPTSQSSTVFRFPGPTPVVSANGITNGIVWALQNDQSSSGGQTVLHAYDATDLANELYNSAQNADRDDPGAAVKFTMPVVANGKVLVGTQTQLSVFGQLSSSPLAGVTVDPPSVMGGTSTTGTVTLQAPAPAGGLEVGLMSSDPSTSVPASVTIAAGALSAQFPVVTSPVATSTDGTVSAINDGTQSASLTVLSSGVTIQINPTMANLTPSQTQQFTATVSGSTNTTVTWSMNPQFGTLDQTGSYTAPSNVSLSQTVTITATAAADTLQKASATLTIAQLTPTITVTGGTFTYDGNPHAATATALGADGHTPVSGTFSFTYTPPGNSTVPINAGTYSVTANFTSTDPNYSNAAGSASITITSSSSSSMMVTLNNTNAAVAAFNSSSFSKPMIVAPGGSNTVAFATVWVDEGSGPTGTTFNVTATFGGQAMTSAGPASYDYNYAPISTQVFYLVNPPTGTNTLAINATASSGTIQEVVANLVSYNGVNQSTPVRPGTYQTLHSANGVTVGTVTATIASNPNDLTLGAIEQTFHFSSPASNQTVDGINGAYFAVGSDHATTAAASVTDIWSFTNPWAYFAYVGFSIQAASGGGTPTLIYTATPTSQTYGSANSAYTGTVIGFIGSDTLANATTGTLTFTSTATASSNVGSYPINGSGLTANAGKYIFAQSSSNATALTITQATPTITVTGGTFAYDGNPHAATATALGADGHTPVSGTFSFTYTPPGNSTVPINAGTYSVTANFTSTDPNYSNAAGSASITITSSSSSSMMVTLNNTNAAVAAFNSSSFSKPMIVAPGGSNTVAFATVWVDEGSGPTGTTFNVTATFGGQAMTSAGPASYDYNYAPISTQVFYLVNPPTGTNTLAIDATASSGTIQEVVANLVSYNGVNQSTPVRPGTYQTLHSANGVTVGTVTATIASNPNDLTLGAIEQTFHFSSPASNQTVDGINGAYFAVGSDHATTAAASVTDIWSFTNPWAYFAYVGFSIQAAQ